MDVCHNCQNLSIMSDNCSNCCEEVVRLLEESSCKEMEEEEELVMALAALAVLSQTSCNFKWQDKRLNGDLHLQKLQHTGQFGSTHHMSFQRFTKLKGMLGNCTVLDAVKSSNSTPDASDHICPELIMHIGL